MNQDNPEHKPLLEHSLYLTFLQETSSKIKPLRSTAQIKQRQKLQIMLKTKNQTKPNSQNNTNYMNTNPKSQKDKKN